MSKALYDVIEAKTRKVKKQYGVVPTSLGASKNLLPVYEIEVIVTGGTTWQDGVYCERNADGSIHVYGTAIELDNKFYFVHPSRLCKFPAGTYTMSLGADLPGSMRVSFEYYSSDGRSWLGNYGAINASNPTRTVEIIEDTSLSLYIFIPVGMTVDITLYPQLEHGSEATDYVPYGEVIEGRTRKIKKSYDVVGGVARQFYSAEFLSYDGEYEVLQVEYEGKICDLYRLKKSGILTLNDDALFWMCSGGENGSNGRYTTDSDVNEREAYGGRGGYGGSLTSGQIASGSNWVVSIGAGGSYTGDGASSITDGTTTYKTGSRPASGYGPGGSTTSWSTAPSGGAGSGESTYPFGLTSLKAHCPGGGGGGAAVYVYSSSASSYVTRHQGGGSGGSNGGNGTGVVGSGSNMWSGDAPGGSGGTYGGGKGGGVSHDNYTFTYTEASAAFYYGAGGGGGTAGGSQGTWKYTNGKSGYQGVVYILDVNGGVLA